MQACWQVLLPAAACLLNSSDTSCSTAGTTPGCSCCSTSARAKSAWASQRGPALRQQLASCSTCAQAKVGMGWGHE